MLTKLKRIRLEKGLKAKSIAQKANISASWYYEIESNKRVPSSKTTQNIANSLKVPLNSIFKANHECKV
ncbi:MAG: helix-turn-helix domain-containing protein [Candidatus Scalindua sp.]